MRKFVIERTKGNEETIIRCFDTREEAMSFGGEYAAKMSREMGLVSLALRDVDENNRQTGNVEWVYHVW